MENKHSKNLAPEEIQHDTSLAKNSLKLIYVYAIATGAIFTFIAYLDTVFIAYCGPATFFAFALMTLLILPIAFVYCELAPMFHKAGGELIYNTVGINKHVGFLAAWMMLATWSVVPVFSITAILQWLNRVAGLGLSMENILIGGIIILVIFCVISLGEIKTAGKIQLFMLVGAVVATVVSTIAIFFSGHWHLSNFTPFFKSTLGGGGFSGWLIGLGLIVTPFFGFETVPQMVEEGDFPIKDSHKAIWGSVVTCGIIYVLFFLAIAGLGSFSDLLHLGSNGEVGVSFLSITAMEEILGWAVWAVIFGAFAHLFSVGTCFLGFWISTVRLMYAMGKQNFLPKVFSYVNKKKQPILPNLFLLAISLIYYVVMNTTTFINDFFNLMSFCCSVTYSLTMISAIRMKIKYPEWERPYKLKGGMFTNVLALCFALCIVFLCSLGLGWGTWRSLLIYLGIGALIWLWMFIFKWPKSKVVITTPGGEMEY